MGSFRVSNFSKMLDQNLAKMYSKKVLNILFKKKLVNQCNITILKIKRGRFVTRP